MEAESQTKNTENLTIKDMLSYLCGREEAIHKIASNSASIWYGAFFVLLAGFAREYDQEVLSDFHMYLIPFGASCVVAGALYVLIQLILLKKVEDSFTISFRQFLALFWMTAPLAFIYAIPVEELTGSLTAVKLNYWMLFIVACWRVWLFSRVIRIITGLSLMFPILLIGGVIIFIVTTQTSMDLGGIMSGAMRTPEAKFLFSMKMLSFVFGVYSIPVTFLVTLWQIFRRSSVRSLPKWSQKGKFNWRILLLLLFLPFAMVVPQKRLNYFRAYEEHLENKEYKQAIDLLSSLEESDLPKTRRLMPLVMNASACRKGFELFKCLNDQHKPWVRKLIHNWTSMSLKTIPRFYQWESEEGLIETLLSRDVYEDAEQKVLIQHKEILQEIAPEELLLKHGLSVLTE